MCCSVSKIGNVITLMNGDSMVIFHHGVLVDFLSESHRNAPDFEVIIVDWDDTLFPTSWLPLAEVEHLM